MKTAEGAWTFKRVGPYVTIRPTIGGAEIATFRSDPWRGGGTLEMADRRRIQANTSFGMNSYEFLNDRDESLVRITRVGGMFKLSSQVEILPAGARLSELPWLVPLGWYLSVKMHDDAASGAAAAVAAAG